MSKKKDKNKNKEKKKVVSTSKQKTRLVRWVVVAFLSLVAVITSLFWVSGDLHYDITETYTFTGEDSGSVHLTVMLPTSGHYQEVLEPVIEWPGTWDIRLNGRLNVLRLEMDLDAGQTAEAVISYGVNLWQGQASWVGEPVTSTDLSPTDLVQSDHPEIVSRAESLQVSGDEARTVEQIFDFTIQHLAWPVEDRINADLSALQALQTGVGGCAEHANLMAALCRAVGIPARTISGLAMPETIPFIPMSATWNHPAGAHAWVEVFVDDVWLIADPSWSGQFYQRDILGWTDGRHLAYDTVPHESDVYLSLVEEAESEGTWIAAMSAPLRFVAWSDLPNESMAFTPQVTLRKTWDARLLMMFAVIIILVVLNWLFDDTSRV